MNKMTLQLIDKTNFSYKLVSFTDTELKFFVVLAEGFVGDEHFFTDFLIEKNKIKTHKTESV